MSALMDHFTAARLQYVMHIGTWLACQFFRSISMSNITGKLCRTYLFSSSWSQKAMILVRFHNKVICSQCIHPWFGFSLHNPPKNGPWNFTTTSIFCPFGRYLKLFKREHLYTLPQKKRNFF